MTQRYELWCVDCPTRIVIEHDKDEVSSVGVDFPAASKFWRGVAYTVCNVCGGTLADPSELLTRGISRYDGSTFKIREKTPVEHARLNATGPEDDKHRERDAWERMGREKGFI